MQRTTGSLRLREVFFSLRVFSALRLLSTFAPPPLAQTVRLLMNPEWKALKEKYERLFESVSAALFEADPVGINFDEQ